MEIKYRIDGKVLHIYLIGELSETTAHITRTTMDSLIDSNKVISVVLHLSQLSFMDSTGIGVLIGRYKKLKQKDASFYVENPSKQVEKIFRMSGLFEIMPQIS